MKAKYMVILGCVLVLSCFYTVIVSAINVDKCSTLDKVGETYTLTQDVSTNWTTCIIITAPGITLDCSGFSISGNNAVNTYNVYSKQYDTTLVNCKIPNSASDPYINITKKALFDIVSEIVTEPKKSGEDLVVKISLINFGALTTIDANLAYSISDSNNKIIKQYNKIVPVTTQVEFLDRINTSELANGKYTLKIELTYEGQTFPAHTEKVFYVGLIKGWFRNVNIKTVLFSTMTIILLISAYIKNHKNKSKENMEDNTSINTNQNKSYNSDNNNQDYKKQDNPNYKNNM